jgi:hypothetical protein
VSKAGVAVHPDLNAIAAFVDDRLAHAERVVVVQHLSECAECRVMLAAFGRAQAAFPSRPHESVGLTRRLRAPATWLLLAATVTIATSVGLLVSRGGSEADRVLSNGRPPQPEVPSAAPTAAVSPPLSATAPETRSTPAPKPLPPAADDLTTRRSGVRQLGGKTFRLVAGEWVDSDYDPLSLLPVETVSASTRASLLDRMPELKPYAALGPNVLVVHRGVVYRFSSS